MELRNINTFLRVVELGSFTNAANALGYSQSTVTIQIKQLEQELGFLLFDRIGKTVSLTSKGNEFVYYANKLAHFEKEALRLSHNGNSINGILRLGAPECLLIWDMPALLAKYHNLYPNVNIEITMANSSDLYIQIKENKIDIAYLIDNSNYRKDYIKTIISSVKLDFVTYPGNPICLSTSLTLSDIVKEPLILAEHEAIYRRCLEIEAARLNIELIPVLEIESLEVIMRLLKMKMGVSFMPEFAMNEYVKNGELAVVNVECAPFNLWNQIVYHKNKFVSPQIEAFIQLMKDVKSSICK